MKKRTSLLVGLLSALLVVCTLFGCASTTGSDTTSNATSGSATSEQKADSTKDSSPYASAWKKRDGYTLTQVVAVSRHNLRAPQDKHLDTLAKSTSNTWVDWTAGGSELTTKGGVAETIMGEFFRKWLEDEQLIPANYMPEDGAVRFYSNPRQRTLATTQFFSSGMLPVANVDIELHGEYDSRDAVFMPRFGYVSDSYTAAATKEIESLGGDKGLAGIDSDLQQSYDLITEVLDYKNSEAYKSDGADLKTGDASYTIKLDEEPKLSGSISKANVLSDALVLQYYQTTDDKEAGFGKELTYDQWKQIAAPKNAYGDRRYDSKLVGVDCARLLVNEVATELDRDGRKFTFMCGHDSNQSSLLHALGVDDYELPDTIETSTPIGSKILFEVWQNAAGEKFCNVRFVYATSDQVRNLTMLTLATPPASYDLNFAGLSRNADGLFKLDDVKALLTQTVSAYDQLAVDYPQADQQADQQAEQAPEQQEEELAQAA